MSASTLLSTEDLSIDRSRRSACAAIGLGIALCGPPALAKEEGSDGLLAEQYALMRRAYQTGDAELLRQFYSPDVVVATEVMAGTSRWLASLSKKAVRRILRREV